MSINKHTNQYLSHSFSITLQMQGFHNYQMGKRKKKGKKKRVGLLYMHMIFQTATMIETCSSLHRRGKKDDSFRTALSCATYHIPYQRVQQNNKKSIMAWYLQK